MGAVPAQVFRHRATSKYMILSGSKPRKPNENKGLMSI